MAHEIMAPTPGIFWHRPEPDAEVFANPGDEISRGEVIGVIEVMKMFMNIEATESCVFNRYLVGHGETVIMGTPLADISRDSV